MKGYSYETWPGQTIVRTCEESGYSWDDLLAELRCSGDGVVTDDTERTDERIQSVVGRDSRTL